VPLLHGRYSASSLVFTPPTSDGPAHAVIDSHAASGLRTPVRRISQVPLPIFRCALPVLTPASRSGAYVGCFPVRAGFAIFGSLATCDLCFEADHRFNLLRLTAHSFAVRSLRHFARVLFPNRPRSPRFVTSTRQAAATCTTNNLHGNLLSDC